MVRNKKNPHSEGASGGGGEVPPQKSGNGSPKGKYSFEDLQGQSTLHLEADVRSNGMLHSWKRKTLMVTKGALYVCTKKSNGWLEKNVLVGMQSEVKLLAPDKKNVHRHLLILIGPDRRELKIGLDSANDQGALAKALESEGATIVGLDSITIYKVFLDNRDGRNRNAPGNDGSITARDDPNEPDTSRTNIYGDLKDKSPKPVSDDLKDGKTANDSLALDDSFLTTLEVDEDSSSREVSSNEPLYKNHEVKLYKKNLRSKEESDLYDKLDHGYGKPKNVIMQATSNHRPAPAVKQNIVLNSQKQSSVAESISELTDEEEIYETTLQIGKEVNRLNSASNDTASSSQRPESSQTCSSEDPLTTHDYDILSLSSNDEQAKKNTAVLQSVEKVKIICDEMKDRSGPTFESLREKNDTEGAIHQPDVRKPDQSVTTLESQGEAHQMKAYDRATDQPKTKFETLGEEHKHINVRNEFDGQTYGTIDRKTYGALHRNASVINNSSTAILEDSAEKLTKSTGVGIYEKLWNISGTSEVSTLTEADFDNHKVNKLIAENQPNDDDCKDSARSSIEHAKIKSDTSVETELSSINKSSRYLEGIPNKIDLQGMVNEQNICELQESAITHSSDSLEKEQDVNSMQEEESSPSVAVSLKNYTDSDQEQRADDQKSTDISEGINNYKPLPDGDNTQSNDSQSSLSIRDDELLNTFVEKVTQTYGPDHVMPMVAVSRSNQQNNTEVESSANNSQDKTSELFGSESSSAVDVRHDIYDNFLGCKNNNSSTVQAEDGLDENSNDDCERYQEEDKNEWVQSDDRRGNHIATDHNGSPEGVINSQSIGRKSRDEEYDLSELLGAITDNSTELNTDNNLKMMSYFDYPNGTPTQNSPSVEEHGVSFVGLPEATAEHVSETDTDMKTKNKSLRIKTEQNDNEAAVNDESHDQLSEERGNDENDNKAAVNDESHDQLSEERGNDESVDQHIEEDAEEPGNLFYDITTFPNNETFTSHDEVLNDSNGQNDTETIFEKSINGKDAASCLENRKSSKKTKKKVRFSDDIQVQSLENTDDESEYDSVFAECEDNSASETNFSNENNPNYKSFAPEDNFEKQQSNSDVQQDLNGSTGPLTIELTESTSNSKSVENSLAISADNSGSNRRPASSKLQQPKKVVLPDLSNGSGRGKTTSTSTTVLEPNAGTCLVDYSRGGKLYQTRILKVEDGCLHFFSSPPNRSGSYPEPGDDGEADGPTARAVHTVELGKSSVVPGLMADGEGLYSITLTHSGGKTVLLKSPNREEQMRLVFLLSDEVMRVTPPEDRVGLLLYPSKVKEPSNKSEDTVQLATSHKIQLTASPRVNSNLGNSSPSSIPPRLPKSVQNESTRPINYDPLTNTHKNEANREPEVKVPPDAKYFSDSTNPREKQLFWQNILKNKTTSFGPESVTNKEVAQSTIPTPSPLTTHSPGPIKANDKTLVSRTSLKPVPDGVNRVKPNLVSNEISFPKKQTADHISLLDSKLSTSSQESNKWMAKKYFDTPVAGTVSKLRSIFELESKNNNGFISLSKFSDDFSNTHLFTNQNKRRSRCRSLDDDQASVPEEVLGAYARPPSIVIKELNDDPSQAEEDGAALSVRDWWSSGTGGFGRDSFGAAHQAELRAVRRFTTTVNYSPMTVEGVAEAINPVLQAKRQKMDSKMVVADIRRTRNHLANRALEQWELAQQMDEGQQLEKKMALQQVALLQKELQQLQAALKQEKRHQKWLKKQLKLREKEG